MIRRWQKVILYSIVVLVGLLAAAITATVGWRPFIGPKARPLTDRRFEPSPARLERGEYLVRNVSGCLFCHSDLDPSVEELPVKAGLAGGAIREGIGHDGRTLFPMMPYANYAKMSDEDPDHAVDNALPRTVCERCGLEHGGGERNKKSD